MFRRLAVLVTLIALVSWLGVSSATAQTFGDLPGLQRVVVRVWMSPDVATPTPQPPSGASLVSLGIFIFDTPENAEATYNTFAAMVDQSAATDPLMAGAKPEPIAGDSDQSSVVIGNRTEQNVALSNIYGIARAGNVLYLIQGAMVQVDAKAEVQRMIQGAVVTPFGGEEQYVFEGASIGGVWDKLNAASPTLVPGSTILDSIVFPPTTPTPAP